MSGSLHDVKNEVWMKTVLISVGLIFAGIAAYAVLAEGVGSVKHHEWEEAHHDVEEAKAELDAISVTDAPSEDKDAAYDKWEAAVDADVDAHLSYLTWSTAGKTIMVMFIIYAAFYGIAGFFNSIQPEEEYQQQEPQHSHLQ